MSSVKQQALEAVATQIGAMSEMSSVFSDTVTVRYLDWEDVYKIGGVTVRYLDDDLESETLRVNERDVIGYRAYVCIVHKRRTPLTEEPSAITTLVQGIRRKFNNRRRMSAVSDSGTHQLACRTVRGPRAPQAGEMGDKIVTTITVICWFMEPREAA